MPTWVYIAFYNDGDQDRPVEAVVQKCIEAAEMGPPSLSDLKGMLESAFLLTATRLKRPGFAAECEWRLLADDRLAAPKVRIRSTSLVPYVEFGLSASPGRTAPAIVEVISGPSYDQARRLRGLHELCRVNTSGPISPETKISKSGFDLRD